MRTERVFLLLFIISLGMRLLHVQGADGVLICTLGGLALLYCFLGFYLFNEDGVPGQVVLISIIAGVLLAIAPVGILFRLQYWPQGKTQAMFGAMFSLITLLVVLMLKFTSEDKRLQKYYTNMVLRSLVLFVLTATLFMVPRSKLIAIEHWDDPKLAGLKIRHLNNREDTAARKAYIMYMRKKGG